MKHIIIALFLISATFAQDSNLQDLWQSWKIQNNKDYSDLETEAMRFEIFSRNHKYIQEWNSAGNTAVLALNKFADLTTEEFSAMYTGLSANFEESLKNVKTVDIAGYYPSSWNWVDNGAVTAVKDQGQCGSCYAYASVVSIEAINKIQGHTLTAFSEQQDIDCDTKNLGCNGGLPKTSDAYYSEYGIEPLADYPDVGKQEKCKYNATEAVKVINGTTYVTPKNVTALFAAVYQQPVVVFTSSSSETFQFYQSGIITTGCTGTIDFTLTVVGYTPEYFILKNAWGTEWGMDGYVWISTSTQYNSGVGACEILLAPQFPTPLAQSVITY